MREDGTQQTAMALRAAAWTREPTLSFESRGLAILGAADTRGQPLSSLGGSVMSQIFYLCDLQEIQDRSSRIVGTARHDASQTWDPPGLNLLTQK